MSLAMHLKAVAFMSAFASAASPADGPSRVVSADLCADAYVFALAQPQNIAAVSWQAGQTVSDAPDWALNLPRANADAERLIALRPDLVVFGPSGAGDAARFLDAAGIRHTALTWGESLESILTNITRIGEQLGEVERAEDIILSLRYRREALAARSAGRSPASVFYLSITGGAAGSETLVDEAIRLAGGRNSAAALGATGWQQADAEWALRVDPDLIVTSFFIDGYATRSNIGARHSAFRRLLSEHPRIDVPASAWACAGPALMDAAEQIADALDVLEPPS